MPDNKQKCNNCKNRHLPPTGKKCKYVDSVNSDAEEVPNGLRDAAAASMSLATDQADPGGQRIQEKILLQLQKMSDRLETVEQGKPSTSAAGTGKLSRSSDFFEISKSTPSKSKKSKQSVPPSDSSESSSDDSDSPSLSFLRSQSMQWISG